MNFPSDFPAYAQAAVIAEQVKASASFNAALNRPAPTSPFSHSEQEHVTALAKKYVLRIFGTFAHQACELGQGVIWTATRVDDASREFLRHLAIDVRVEFGELPIRKMITDMGYITSAVWQEFTTSPEWKKYQEELLEVAELQTRSSGQKKPTPALGVVTLPSATVRPIGEQLEELRAECEISIEELAALLHIDPTNVSRHLNGKSQPSPKSRSAYGRVFSKLLKENIVIGRMHVKRSQNAAKKS